MARASRKGRPARADAATGDETSRIRRPLVAINRVSKTVNGRQALRLSRASVVVEDQIGPRGTSAKGKAKEVHEAIPARPLRSPRRDDPGASREAAAPCTRHRGAMVFGPRR